MNKYIIFVRSLNISGKNIIKMKELKEELSNIKHFKNVFTYIQTGNLVINFDKTKTTMTTTTDKEEIIKEEEEEEEQEQEHVDDDDVNEIICYKTIINKLIKDCLYNKFSIDTQLIVYDIDEYKSILSNNPFNDEKEIKRTYFFFPCETPIDKSIYDILKSDMKNESKWELVNGVIYYIGRLCGPSSELKVINKLNKYIKSAPYLYTTRNYNTVYKMLNLSAE